MSIKIFKTNMLIFMNNPEGITDVKQFSKKLANEYDQLIKRGGDTINKVAVEKGNVEILESLLTSVLLQYSIKQSGDSNIIPDMGNAFISYWSGATLNKFPIPIQPAVGTFQNISTISATVSTTGEWKPKKSTSFPNTDSNVFLDQLISFIQTHLTTVGGNFQTISLYIPTGTPSPAILQWSGYTIN